MLSFTSRINRNLNSSFVHSRNTYSAHMKAAAAWCQVARIQHYIEKGTKYYYYYYYYYHYYYYEYFYWYYNKQILSQKIHSESIVFAGPLNSSMWTKRSPFDSCSIKMLAQLSAFKSRHIARPLQRWEMEQPTCYSHTNNLSYCKAARL